MKNIHVLSSFFFKYKEKIYPVWKMYYNIVSFLPNLSKGSDSWTLYYQTAFFLWLMLMVNFGGLSPESDKSG